MKIICAECNLEVKDHFTKFKGNFIHENCIKQAIQKAGSDQARDDLEVVLSFSTKTDDQSALQTA